MLILQTVPPSTSVSLPALFLSPLSYTIPSPLSPLPLSGILLSPEQASYTVRESDGSVAVCLKYSGAYQGQFNVTMATEDDSAQGN